MSGADATANLKNHGDTATPLVTVVIVNWNAGPLLADCLTSIADDNQRGDVRVNVVVVDNASTDNSAEIAERMPGVRLLRNERNRGFGFACNQGAALADGNYILFLNPDCRVSPGSIASCVQVLRSDKGVGACGIALADDTGHFGRTCHRFPGLGNFLVQIFGLYYLSRHFSTGRMSEWDHAQDRDVDHIIGAFYLVRRDLFEKLHGFDERFFVYLEDLDLSLRIHQMGYRIHYLASPPSYHLCGGVSRQIKATRLFYSTRSRLQYGFKHLPRWQAWLHFAVTMLIEPVNRTLLAVLHRSRSEVTETWQGFRMLWRNYRTALPDKKSP